MMDKIRFTKFEQDRFLRRVRHIQEKASLRAEKLRARAMATAVITESIAMQERAAYIQYLAFFLKSRWGTQDHHWNRT